MHQKVTLLELNKLIQDTISVNFSESLWIVAEISELKINRNGHCYLELVEKDVINENIIAKTRATIWAFTFRMLKPYFESATGQELSTGLKVLIKVKIEFHELYGLSLIITDIDPNYTIGDLALKRAQTINKLISEGVFEMNKEISFPEVPQKIAVISSDTAAGYQDFINQLENNSLGYKFYIKLFPSIMQGLQAEESIIASLESIYKYEDFFDVVVIIRGGGSQSDLQCFNNYLLATNVAQFPLPVLTGIGHDKDESVVDLVAHSKLKTPTAVAEFIIDKTFEFEERLNDLKEGISERMYDFIDIQKSNLSNFNQIIAPLVRNNLSRKNFKLKILAEQLKTKAKKTIHFNSKELMQISSLLMFKAEKIIHRNTNYLIKTKVTLEHKISKYTQKQNFLLESIKNKLELLDPTNILERGYSITYFKGKRVKYSDDINECDEIITKLFNGIIRSTVKDNMSKTENN